MSVRYVTDFYGRDVQIRGLHDMADDGFGNLIQVPFGVGSPYSWVMCEWMFGGVLEPERVWRERHRQRQRQAEASARASLCQA